MKVLAAEYVVSAAEPGRFPAGDLPEIAVAGRSNVGKSSLLNILLGRKNLARVSQTPGRTRLLTFFRVMLASQGAEGSPEKFLFVDLPGYGYARVAKAVHEQWGPMIEGYLSSRASLRGVVLLTDIRRGEEDEVNLVRWLDEQELGLVAVAAKSDKLPRGRRLQALRDLETFLGVPVIGCSAVTGEGKDVVWKAIRELLARPRRAKAGSRCSSCPSVP